MLTAPPKLPVNKLAKPDNAALNSVCYLISETIPREHLEELKQIFESGITMWHLENNVTPLDYSVSNNPV